MKKLLYLLIIVAAAGGGWWFGTNHSTGHRDGATGRKIRFYQSPMHPWIKSDSPGRCTICGMELTPVYEGQAGLNAESPLVTLSAESVTVTGVATNLVKREPITRTIRVAGMIDDDDSTHRRLSATADGRIERLFVNYVGAEVEAGQPLATIYSPALRTMFSEFQLVAHQAPSAQRTQLLGGIRDRLLRLGLSPGELDKAVDSNDVPLELKVLSPITGTVVERGAYEGQYVKEGDMLFEVADFSKMWFIFDAYERDLPWLRVGAEVRITTPALPGRVLKAPISFIDPNLNPSTRSARIRVVLENPVSKDPQKHRHELLHKLYAEGLIEVTTAPVLTVPRTAVIWPMGRPIVYVMQHEGAYEPRVVQIGASGDDVWEVAGGLEEGERVVTTGNLLLDAQAQINHPAESAAPLPGETLSPEQRDAALGYFRAVSTMGGALSSDDSEAFRKAVEEARGPASELRVQFGDRVVELLKAAGEVGGTNLSEQRAAFYPLSEAAAQFALALRRETKGMETVRVFACDMAKQNVPSAPRERGYWIQMQSGVRNPWWGSQMLDCGAEVKP